MSAASGLMFERALVPLHLRERRPRVEALVSLLGRLSFHHVRLLHVAGSATGSRRTAREVEQLAEELTRAGISREELTVSAQTTTGSAVTEIIQTAVAQEADLIAVPWKRKNWVQRSLLGSTSLDLIRLAPIPVLIQKSSLGRNPGAEEPLSVLYASDLGKSDERAVRLIEGGALGSIRLTILNAGRRAPDPQAESRRVAAVEAALTGLAERVRSVVDTVETVAITGSSRTVIPAYLRREKFHVAILGTGSSGSQPILGSTAEEVAYRSPGSVLIVPSSPEEGGSDA
ncbi:MAG: universal stress protein [Alkalispirochaeta sp.]